MSKKRESKIQKRGLYLLRLLLAFLMAPYLISGTLPSQAATVVEQGVVTREQVASGLNTPIKAPSDTYQLSITITGGGSGTVTDNVISSINCGSGTCLYDLNSITEVNLTANPATDSVFTGWGGACVGTGTCTLTMSEARSVTAAFDVPVEVTDFDLLQSVAPPTWDTVPGDLTDSFTMTLNPTQEWYYLNVANLVANRDLKVGYHPFFVQSVPNQTDWFAFWADKGVTAEADPDTWQSWMWQIINGDQPIFYLKVDDTGGGQSFMLVDGLIKDTSPTHDDTYLRVNGTYLPGKYTFTGTISDKLGTSSQLPVDITFKLVQYQLTVNKDGNGSGTVTSNPPGISCGTGADCQHDFDANTVVTLTATTPTSSSFTGWNGVGCTGTGDCVVTMSTAKTVKATFTLNKYDLSVIITGTGTVSSNPAGIDCGSSCDHDYDYNTIVTLTATPASGWSFFGWSGDLGGTTNSITITIDDDKSVAAVFKQYFVFLPAVRNDPLFVDYFDYTDPNLVFNNWEIVPETGATWFVLNGGFHGKHTVVDRNAKAVAKIYSPRMPASYSVEAKVQLATGSVAGGRGGLLFDYLSTTQTYRFGIVPWSTVGTNWVVQKRLPPPADTWALIASGLDPVHINPGTAVNLLRVERVGTQIRVYANGSLLWSGNDGTYTNGRAGFNIGTPTVLSSGEFVEVIFDDFVIDSLP